MSDSRPQIQEERERVVREMTHHVGDTTQFRIQQAEKMGEMVATMRHVVKWMDIHEVKDEKRFLAMEEKLDKKIGGVQSSVTEIGGAKDAATNQLEGAKKVFVYGSAIFGGIAGIVGFIALVLELMGP